tara:strand:- start:33 stop:569 length:537 start_codon:yes stop_codon:yes gene_type:complete
MLAMILAQRTVGNFMKVLFLRAIYLLAMTVVVARLAVNQFMFVNVLGLHAFALLLMPVARIAGFLMMVVAQNARKMVLATLVPLQHRIVLTAPVPSATLMTRVVSRVLMTVMARRLPITRCTSAFAVCQRTVQNFTICTKPIVMTMEELGLKLMTPVTVYMLTVAMVEIAKVMIVERQ